ncbi:ATP-dependent RNA helicase DEAH11, chloroplastic isoform B [Glycine soja]|uniref:RBR-type E3 ubiquitin transferase n=1 Tax=Glycine soja TaxID=3848 RepID=A0A445I1P3_GLYSO|nr:ATP-dependent RNA helicase DEAH11, chloroplastic isoform B [Glycine soja]
MDFTQDLHCLLSEQRRKLAAAEAMELDLDFAFRLQLKEALAASLAAQPSSSSSAAAAIIEQPVVVIHDDDVNAMTLQREELARMEREMKDREQSEAETLKMREELCRRIHDEKVAREISAIPEKDWQQWGDNFEKPFGEGSSSSSLSREEGVVRVYFKGLVSEENVRGRKVVLSGIGVAICDLSDNLIFEVSKSLIGNGTSKVAAEIKALIEAFNAAIALDLKRVVYCCDYYPLFQFVSGKWPAKQRKIAILVDQVNLLQRKFSYCNPRFVARHDVKFAFKLARDAIESQSTRLAESGSRSLNETCVICLEETDVGQIFSVDGCQHRYCFSCMKQHVEVKLLHGMVPKCPHQGCKYELLVDSCQKFLTQKLTETMQQRKLEASIPVAEKIYCPYPTCSALMSKTEVLEYSKDITGQSEQSEPKICLKCRGLFCFNCKVPWHSGMTCNTYKRMNPIPPAEDLKLKFLASRSLWQQCLKCNHMIELAEGCYHMTCRYHNNIFFVLTYYNTPSSKIFFLSFLLARVSIHNSP